MPNDYEDSSAAFLKAIGLLDPVDPRTGGIKQFRDHSSRLMIEHTTDVPSGVTISSLEIPGRNGQIPIRTYSCSGVNEARPVVVYLHGGAWAIGSLEDYDGVCGYLARGGDVVVVSVDYRLAPENKFPKAVEDSCDAVSWVAGCLASLGGDPEKLAIAGDSAGGNLAAVVCQQARKMTRLNIQRQLLFYPCLAPLSHDHYPSRRAFGGPGNFLNEASLEYMLELYRRTPKDDADPRLWPLLDRELSGLPEAYIVTAEFDMLRDEAMVYAEELAKAGVTVKTREYARTIHGFMGFAGTINPGRAALDDVCAYLREW